MGGGKTKLPLRTQDNDQSEVETKVIRAANTPLGAQGAAGGGNSMAKEMIASQGDDEKIGHHTLQETRDNLRDPGERRFAIYAMRDYAKAGRLQPADFDSRKPEGEGEEEGPPEGTDIDAILEQATVEGGPDEEPEDAVDDLAEEVPEAEEEDAKVPEDEQATVEESEMAGAAGAPTPQPRDKAPVMEMGQGANAPAMATLPGTAPKSVQGAVLALQQNAQLQKDALDAEGALQQEGVRTAAQTAKDGARTALDQVRGQVDGSFDQLAQDVKDLAQRTRDGIDAALEAQKTRVTDGAQAQIERVRKAVEDRKSQTTELGESLALRAEAHGQSEATRLVVKTKEMATRCLAIGEAKVQQFAKYDEAKEIAKTARSMAKKAGQSIVDAGAEGAQGAINNGKALAKKLREDAKSYADNLKVDEDVVSTIEKGRDEAIKHMGAGRDQQVAAVDQLEGTALEQVEQARGQALTRLDQSLTALDPGIDAAAEMVCQAIQQTVDEAKASLDSAVADAIQRVGALPPEVGEQAARVFDGLQGELAANGGLALQQVASIGQQGVGGIGMAGASAVDGILQSQMAVDSTNAETLSKFDAAFLDIQTKATETFTKAGDQGMEAITKAADGFVEKIDEAYQEGLKGLNDSYTKGAGEITSKVNEAIAGFSTTVNELGPKITSKANDIEDASWWDKLCSAVGAFCRGFWQALCAMVEGLLSILPWLLLAIVIIIVVIVIIAVLAPQLLLAVALLCVLYAAQIAAVFTIGMLLVGIGFFAYAVYKEWDILTDPNYSWEQKWEAVGRLGFEGVMCALDVLAAVKLFKAASKLDELGDIAKLDDVKPIVRHIDDLEDVGSAGGKLDDLVDTSKLDEVGDAGKGDVPKADGPKVDAGDAGKVDDAPTSGGKKTGGTSLDELKKTHGLPDDVVEVLEHAKISPDDADFLLKKGMNPIDLGAAAAEYGSKGTDILTGVVKSGMSNGDAIKLLDNAGSAGVLDQVHALTKTGKLKNPQSLNGLIKKIKDPGQGPGHLDELNLAAERALKGSDVEIGGSKLTGQADVIDLTRKEAIQNKVVTSKDPMKVEENLSKAIDQLSGKHGEVPPEGFTRTARVDVRGPKNPVTDMGADELSDLVKRTVGDNPNVDRVVIKNNKGTFTFEKPFDGVSGSGSPKKLLDMGEDVGRHTVPEEGGKLGDSGAKNLQPDDSLPKVRPDHEATSSYKDYGDKPAFDKGADGGSKGAALENVNQGQLGDCYFCAGMGATAKADPSAIAKLIKDNGDGTYDITLWLRNKAGQLEPVTKTVDSRLPSKGANPIYAKGAAADPGDVAGIWPALLEKRLAMEPGSYDLISGGNIGKNLDGGFGGATELLRGKAERYVSMSKLKSMGDADMLKTIQNALDQGHPMTMDSMNMAKGSDLAKEAAKYNVYGNHAYIVDKVDEAAKTISLKNPWGSSHVVDLPLELFHKFYRSLRMGAK